MEIVLESKNINSNAEILNAEINENLGVVSEATISEAKNTLSRTGQRKLRQANFVAMAQIKLANPKEIEMLSRDCDQIIAQINSQFSAMGARRSSGRNNAVRDAITRYLTSRGTPAALELLRNFEQRGWNV